MYCSSKFYLTFTAVRMVSAGHRMVAEGWALFEEACMEVGPGDLPGLLRRIVSSTTPTPSATPAPSGSAAREEKEEDVVTEGEAATLFTPIKEELERMEKKEEGGGTGWCGTRCPYPNMMG